VQPLVQEGIQRSQTKETTSLQREIAHVLFQIDQYWVNSPTCLGQMP
jgi:hypothetical protein